MSAAAVPVILQYCDENPLEGLRWDMECMCEYGVLPIEVGAAALITGCICPPRDPPSPLAEGGLGEALV